jgi:hypothetical protein
MKKAHRFAALIVLFASLAVMSGTAHAGIPLGPDRFLIYNDGSVSEEESAIAYNSRDQEYLVVWQAAEIWGRRVSASGVPIGSAFRISPTGEGVNPDVAYSSSANEYLVVWHHDVFVAGQRVSASGTLQGNVFNYVAGSSGVSSCDQPAIAYGSVADRYLLSFRYYIYTDSSSSIWVDVIQSDGVSATSAFSVRENSDTDVPEEPDVAYNRSRNEFLVVWQETWDVGDRDIYGRRVAMDGGASALGSPFSITLSVNDDTAPAVAAIPTVSGEGQYLVAWQTNQDIRARTVAGDETLGSYQTLASTPWGEYRPAVAGSESNDQFLVTWTWIPVVTPPAMMQVQAKTLALDGTPLHDTTLVGGGQVFDSAVAAGPTGDYLVTFDDNEVFGTSSRGIYARLWGNRVYLPLVLRQ